MSPVRAVPAVLAALVLLGAQAAAATPTWESSRLLIGRSHPMLLHFPIALLLVAGLLELWGAVVGRTERSPAARTCLALGALSAVLAAFSGWTWAEREPVSAIQAERLDLHRWAGVSVAGLSLLAWACLGGSQEGARTTARRVGRVALLACVGGVLFTGHEGGELARGEAFLHDAIDEFLAGADGAAPGPVDVDEPAVPAVDVGPADGPAEDPAAAAFDFAGLVQPILGARCVECHGSAKQKSGIRLDRPDEALFAEFEGERVIARGDPDASTLIRMVSLPHDDLDIMPPEGDPLSAEQIQVLRDWIAAGAPWPEG